ncbi:hypothetical protein AB0L53_46680 [Nonomuraea sp. NPDC052129]|uniref:hypothetical protein n=1 Tax=Nonomuraea sp. NPDC052129 TaxID=3154651 RepID=UPI003435C3FF
MYKIALERPASLEGRSWRWLRARTLGLLDADTRIARALTPDKGRPRLEVRASTPPPRTMQPS